jgi:photosystem II stability/assembly factor-like uncharacterized protein
MKNNLMIRKIIALLSLIVCTQLGFAQDLNKELSPLKWRSIGPFRGGRSNMATGVINNRDIYYMGTTGGGLWKTENSGMSWNNISDGFFKTGSVGAVAVAESDANIVYVGMGEHAVRGVMTHHGDGVYKSTDAGKTWKKMGLDATQHISRIAIDPKNPNIVFVAAQGALYSKSTERGIYKSVDGGTTWKKVLYVDDKTGCAEISMDMHNTSIMYAAMWEHGRLPWQVISGGPGSGLYKSTDGGNKWEKMEKGLIQRITALNLFLADIYADQKIIKDGIIPKEVIYSSKNFLEPCMGIKPPKNIWIHITGTDLIRGNDGEDMVLEDNLRCPSGVSLCIKLTIN